MTEIPLEVQFAATTGREPVQGVCTGPFAAIWIERGGLWINDAPVRDGHAALLTAGDRYAAEPAVSARRAYFAVSIGQASFAGAKQALVPAGPTLLRLDEVVQVSPG